MNKRKILSASVLLICLAASALVAFGQQGRYANVYSRTQVEGFVQQLETSSDAFYSDFRREVDNSGLSSSTRRTFNAYATQFENAVDRLRARFDSSDAWWESRNEVRNMISSSQNINTTMNSAAFRRRIERQWNRLRNDINKLADTYDLAGLNGGGWMGGPRDPDGQGFPGRGGNVPSWAQGTFYARNPQNGGTIQMTVNRNGSVTLTYDNGAPIYASMNGTILNNPPYRSRVSRISNGIRTTSTSNGDFIDYYRSPPGPGWGGNPDGGGGDVPSWAVGTFYARNPTNGGTIQMSVQQNGSVTLVFDNGAPIYATINGTILNNPPYQSRISRIRNGIRTTDITNGSYIDYTRSQ